MKNEQHYTKILIIEDDPDHLELINLSLKKMNNIEVRVEYTLYEAFKVIQSYQPNLIIADVKLPDGNSIDFLKENQIIQNIHTIIMTSYGDEQIAVNALKSGAKDYIIKSAEAFSKMEIIVERATREINALKEKEAYKNEVERNEKKYRTMFESANDGILIMESSTIVDCNLKALNIFGLDKKEDILGKTPFDFSPAEQYNGENSYEKGQKSIQIAHTGISQRFRWKHIKNDGAEFDAEISLNPFDVDHEKLIHVVINDITKKLKREELEKEVEIARRSSKVKEQFLANMSHEIRTPLNSIIGFIDLLKKTHLDNNQRDFLEMVDESSGLLLNLINDILDISKIEAGKLVLYPKTIDVCSIFKKAESLFKYSAKQKSNTLGFDCNNLEKHYIKIDETRLLQVITNLVSNAVKFTHNGSIHVKLFKIEETNGKVLFKMEVTDTGIGIAKENQAQLFDFFSQVNANLTSNIKGAGLGLAISKQLVNMMGGEIGVESEPGKGSKFWFTFKAEKTGEKPEQESIKPSKEVETINLGITILLAEDKILNQKVVSMMLQNAGCKVEIANNGLEVLELFSENKFDIILMDIHMPDMDGITALNKLKEKYQELPPVIGLSASAMEGDAKKYINKGLDDYMAKPVKFNDLYQKIVEWL